DRAWPDRRLALGARSRESIAPHRTRLMYRWRACVLARPLLLHVCLWLNFLVKLTIPWIGKTKEPAIQTLTDEYLKRLGRYANVEGVALKDETALLKFCGRGARPHMLCCWMAKGSSFLQRSSRDGCMITKCATPCHCCSGSAQRMVSATKPGMPQNSSCH